MLKAFPNHNHMRGTNTDICRDSGEVPGYEKLVTDRIGVDDIVEKGFEALIHNKDKHIKILVSPKNRIAA